MKKQNHKMAIDQTNEIVHEGNWVAMYVFVALIPFIAGAVMAYSNWLDRSSRPVTDEEMAAHAIAYQRVWFPWRDAATASESSRPRDTMMGARPPVLPPSFSVTAAAAPEPPASSSGNGVAANKTPMANNSQVPVTEVIPEPPPALAMPVPAAYPSRMGQKPYDNSNDRWGEGPYGYGSNRNNMSRYTPTPTQDFQDVPF